MDNNIPEINELIKQFSTTQILSYELSDEQMQILSTIFKFPQSAQRTTFL